MTYFRSGHGLEDTIRIQSVVTRDLTTTRWRYESPEEIMDECEIKDKCDRRKVIDTVFSKSQYDIIPDFSRR
jgi:hypothetical protein